ncbi:MAG TPA: thiaminase II [Streptosporangiaceae bacterium]|nr:thiaminase II [Streptosporangiaceae bacterium]
MSQAAAGPAITGRAAAGPPAASAALREAGREAWTAAVRHPMVAAIAAGTLPHRVFRGYFEQNVRYLEDYARAIALTAAKAPDRAALAVLSAFLRQIVATEIPANLDFLARLGGSAERLPGPAALHPVTYAYTRHLLHVCAQQGCAEGLAALLPCQWSYGEIAQPLMAAPPADPVYADWIRMFGSAGYDALVAETTALLDRLADPADPGQWSRLAEVFSVSVRYEGEFWDMAYAAA